MQSEKEEKAIFIPKSELVAIRQRCEATPPGPWIWYEEYPPAEYDPFIKIIAPRESGHIEHFRPFILLEGEFDAQRENAKFICKAREDILKLITVIEKLQSLLCLNSEKDPFDTP